jgi:uncharacterized protein YfeS
MNSYIEPLDFKQVSTNQWMADTQFGTFLVRKTRDNHFEAYEENSYIDIFDTMEDAIKSCFDEYSGQVSPFITEEGMDILNYLDKSVFKLNDTVEYLGERYVVTGLNDDYITMDNDNNALHIDIVSDEFKNIKLKSRLVEF